MSLTVEELEAKVERAKKDLDAMRGAGQGGRQVEVMTEYIEMLEDELADAKRKTA